MKRIIQGAMCAILFSACVSTPYMIETEGAFQNTVNRVVQRHDAYVQADEGKDADSEASALAESSELLTLAQLPLVSGSILANALAPVADRHDAYVIAQEIDVLVRDIYLEDTARLRSLLATASEYEPAN